MRTYKSVGYKKRQYEDFARIIGKCESLAGLVAQIENLFAEDNPRFDRERFNDRIREYQQGKHS
jgi:hypothetical protein